MNITSSTGSIKVDGNGMTITSPTGNMTMNGRNIDITGSSGSRVKITRTANGGTRTEIISSGGRSIVTKSRFGGGGMNAISVNGRQIIAGEHGTQIVGVGPDTYVGTHYKGMTGRVQDVTVVSTASVLISKRVLTNLKDTVVHTSFLLFFGGLVGAVLAFSLR